MDRSKARFPPGVQCRDRVLLRRGRGVAGEQRDAMGGAVGHAMFGLEHGHDLRVA